MKPSVIKRQDFLKYTALGVTGLSVPGMLGAGETPKPVKPDQKFYSELLELVLKTPFIDTHEHIMNESERINAGRTIDGKANDWSFLLSHYFEDDMSVSGMNPKAKEQFFSPDTDPLQKWDLIAPFWPFLKHTGYGQSLRISVKQLYGIEEITGESIPALQQAYKALIRPGFYRKVIREVSNIESCHVNRWPFLESEQPDLLKSDLHVDELIQNGGNLEYARESGIKVNSLEDWYKVIDYWLAAYGPKSVGIKCSMAYGRDIDFIPTPADQVRSFFERHLAGKSLEPAEVKALEDHLFWDIVDKATVMGLPVKLHTGYYVWHGYMPLSRLQANPGSACELCRHSPKTKFVFFHIGYPYYEDMLALAKHYPNAYIDMCWSWIINPISGIKPSDTIICGSSFYFTFLYWNKSPLSNGVQTQALRPLFLNAWLAQVLQV
ncbi:MAG: amidohydrolase family protein [Bacteroidia bacterium]|nr:amidohydrolase family protein [Bacteroidia bacterium]